MMTVGQLRRALDGLGDDKPVVLCTAFMVYGHGDLALGGNTLGSRSKTRVPTGSRPLHQHIDQVDRGPIDTTDAGRGTLGVILFAGIE